MAINLNSSRNPVSNHQVPLQLSPKERLLAHHSSLLKWLQCPEAELFNEWIQDLRLRENKKLMEATDEIKVFRAQGSVGILDLLVTLKDDLRQYERDILEGRIHPITEGAPQ